MKKGAMEFAEDVIQYIFSWLPAKSIYRFTTACKSLSEIPTQEYFASNQTHNLQLKNDSGFLMYNDCDYKLEFHPLPGEELSSGLPPKSLRFLETKSILAASNSLIVYQNSTSTGPNKELFICNPATQTWKAIPIPQEDESDGDHRMHGIVVLEDHMLLNLKEPKEWEESHYYECKVYSTKEGEWKQKEKLYKGARSLSLDMPVTLNGVIHFISDCFPYYVKKSPCYLPYIMAYDINNSASRRLRVPKEAGKGSHDISCKMSIFKWGSKETTSLQSICLVRLRKLVFTAWVLEDYNSESWVRIMKIRVKAMGLAERNPIIAGFTVINGNSLIFATENNVYKYGLVGDKYGQIEKVCEHKCGGSVCFNSYSNSLHPLGFGAAPLPDV